MATSDTEANRCLNDLVSRGGAYWVGLSLTRPDAALTPGSITDAGLPRVQLPLNGSATWEAASGRQVQPLAALRLPTPDADLVPVAVILWSAQSGGTPLRSAWLVDTVVPAGSEISLPPAALAITYLQ